MEEQEYDVVIVGSGIAGAIVAKTLTQAGKKVLLLEAGLAAGAAFDKDAAYNTYQDYINTFYQAAVKTPNSPFPVVADALSVDSLDLEVLTPQNTPQTTGYLVQNGPAPFGSDNLRAPGGTTLHWLGSTPRMLPNDFKMKSTYGVGEDWPITYRELMPYYAMAEFEIGIAGDAAAQVGPDSSVRNYGKDYVFPMQKIPQSYMDKFWIRNTENLEVELDGKDYRLTCIPTPQGRNSMPNPRYDIGAVKWNPSANRLELERTDQPYQPKTALWDPYTGQRCEGNSACVPICPVQAKYNALKTLKTADARHLNIVTQAVASRLLIDESTKEISGIEYKRYRYENSSVYTTGVARGKIYVLAAHAIENAKILLASNAANSSGQVGRNLMDHLVMLVWGLAPEKVYPFRGPHCISHIPTFRDGSFRQRHAGWSSPFNNFGWGWPVNSPFFDVGNAVTAGMFGKKIRRYLHDTITRQVTMHFETEQVADPANRVTISPQYTDNIGNYRPVVNYNISDYQLKAFAAARKISLQVFAANNVQDHTVYSAAIDPGYVTYQGQGYTWRGAGHMAGTHRMGSSSKESVVNADQRTWDHRNLYLVGCGNMPTVGTSNPTVTMAAITFKAAEAILKQLNKK